MVDVLDNKPVFGFEGSIPRLERVSTFVLGYGPGV